MELRYPVYVISKGRWERPFTADCLVRDNVPFRIVVEPQEEEQYRAKFGDRVLVLPFSNLGLGSIPARNFCWEHSIEQGHARHWMLDDNIRSMKRWHKGRRILCDWSIALAAMEEFADRYTNVGIIGPGYQTFAIGTRPPFTLNSHVYSTLLIQNAMPYRWRGRYNEDTDLCLQVLSGGLCTVQVQAFLIEKNQTMRQRGGNTDELYADDGRLRMARSLERQWPGISETKRRFQRPQHVIAKSWRAFDTPLIRRDDVDFDALDDSKWAMTEQRVRPPTRRSRYAAPQKATDGGDR